MASAEHVDAHGGSLQPRGRRGTLSEASQVQTILGLGVPVRTESHVQLSRLLHHDEVNKLAG